MANEILSPNYILPDNDVWLFKGVPLEDNYQDSVIWEVGKNVDGSQIAPQESIEQARERQFQYFTENVGTEPRYPHIRLAAMTYLREGRKYLRIDLPYTSAIQYNYMIFKNNGEYAIAPNTSGYHYEHRYYYAFITKFEYINDKTTLVHYEIDLLQTYNFDYELDECMIEREHSATDSPGDNLIPEKIEIGEKICDSDYRCWARVEHTGEFDEYFDLFAIDKITVVVASTFTYTVTEDQHYTLQNVGGHIQNGVYSGLHFSYFDLFAGGDHPDVNELNNLLRAVADAGQESGIVSIFAIPAKFTNPPYSYQGNTYNPVEYNWDIPLTSQGIEKEWMYSYKINGQTYYKKPNNKKLYTQPFTDLVVYNGLGDLAKYGFEYFKEEQATSADFKFIRLKIYATTGTAPEITCVPYNYKGITQNFIEKINIDNFPQCSYAIDAYRAWLAQNKVRFANQLMGAGLSAVMGGLVAGPIGIAGGFANIFSTTANLVTEAYQHSILPPQAKGNTTPYLSLADDELGFHAYCFRPNDEYAQIIDNYFDLYGYATHKVKIPNRTVRPYWCFTKTIGCRLKSIRRGIPADVDNAIRKIYDNGIRFWKNPANIGNYSLNNQV